MVSKIKKIHFKESIFSPELWISALIYFSLADIYMDRLSLLLFSLLTGTKPVSGDIISAIIFFYIYLFLAYILFVISFLAVCFLSKE